MLTPFAANAFARRDRRLGLLAIFDGGRYARPASQGETCYSQDETLTRLILAARYLPSGSSRGLRARNAARALNEQGIVRRGGIVTSFVMAD
jgi:hypothetical protein